MSATCDACNQNVERFVASHRGGGASGLGPALCYACIAKYAECVQTACETVIAAEVPRAKHITRNNARRNLQ